MVVEDRAARREPRKICERFVTIRWHCGSVEAVEQDEDAFHTAWVIYDIRLVNMASLMRMAGRVRVHCTGCSTPNEGPLMGFPQIELIAGTRSILTRRFKITGT